MRGEADVLRAVESVHAMIDQEISAGTRPEDVFVFGLSQGGNHAQSPTGTTHHSVLCSVVYQQTEDEIACAGALSIASVLLYPKTLGGCAVFSGFLPFGASFASRVTAEAKKTPVLWVHGQADFLVPIEAGKDGTKFLRGRLGMRCEFKVYERLGHELAPYELQYCEQWADGGGGGSGEQVQGTSVDPGVPRSRGSCSCGFSFFSRS